MRSIRLLLCLFWATVAYAEQPQPNAAVPKLVRFSSSFRPANGQPAQSVESVTLGVYHDQTGGDALWHEIQNVAVDADGHYSLLMGATQNEGMPLDLFSSGEPRWLGVHFNQPGETEQPRVLLVSVPYALKAADAETLGGKPASAYLLAGAPVGASTGLSSSTTTTTSAKSTKATTPACSGFTKFIAEFVDTSGDVCDSPIYDANGYIGISTTQPAISLDVRTGSLPQMGIAGNTDYLTFFASDIYGPAIYWDPAKDMRFGKGGVGLYNPYGFVEQMRIQSSTGNVGIGTMTPGSKLDVVGDVNFTGGIRYQANPMLQFPGGLSGGNIALGLGALRSNSTGGGNTAIGTGALQNNTTQCCNTAIGGAALESNTLGSFNTASGNNALGSNTTGSDNTAAGVSALTSNTTGGDNTATGVSAMSFNTTGSLNTATGTNALWNNTIGNDNTATGSSALTSNTTGSNNTAMGTGALSINTTGSNNIAIGNQAANNVAGGNSNIHIGSRGSSGDSATIRIGDAGIYFSFFAAGIRGVTTGNNDAIPVMIDSAGQLGTVSSSRRFKEDIEDMGTASRDLMRLRPVTYRYKQPFADGSKPIQYGLIAEEVAEVYPDLVAHSTDGQIETVKYQVLDSMLLNEVERQQAEIRSLQQQINELKAGLALVSGAAKVSNIQ